MQLKLISRNAVVKPKNEKVVHNVLSDVLIEISINKSMDPRIISKCAVSWENDIIEFQMRW